MQTYYVNEAAFALPDRTFVDRTLHRFDVPVDDGALAIEIRRLPIAKGKSLRALVEEEVEAARADGHTVLDQLEADVGGAPALLLRTRLRANDDVYLQLKAHVAFEETWITVVVTGPGVARAACEEAFERAVRTLAWRTT